MDIDTLEDLAKELKNDKNENVMELFEEYAKINNINSEIIKTNAIFSGLKLPAGKSEISINYFPNSFIYGATLSFLTLLFLLFINLINIEKLFSVKK